MDIHEKKKITAIMITRQCTQVNETQGRRKMHMLDTKDYQRKDIKLDYLKTMGSHS